MLVEQPGVSVVTALLSGWVYAWVQLLLVGLSSDHIQSPLSYNFLQAWP